MAAVTAKTTIPPGVSDLIVHTTAIANSAQNDVDGGATVIKQVEIDATANTGENVYLKGYDHAAPTVGTTAPILVLPCIKGTKMTYDMLDTGVSFATALSFACVQEAGQAGTTSPSGSVNVTILLG